VPIVWNNAASLVAVAWEADSRWLQWGVEVMARYYFNLVHGKNTYENENGKECSDIRSVRTEAGAAARRLMKRSSPRFKLVKMGRARRRCRG